jgi:hypothetical protein
LTKAADKGTGETIVIDCSTPLQGLSAAETGFNRTARKIATDPTAAADPNNAVDLLNSRNQFAANLNTLKVGDEMTKATLDILA